MSRQAEATAVAPTQAINGKDIAIHTAVQVGAGLHTGFTFMADVAKFATARIVNKIDSTVSIEDTATRIDGITAIRLEKCENWLAGRPKLVINK